MKYKFIFFLCFFVFPIYGQKSINTKFITHLTTNNLKSEHLTYLKSLPENDTTHYYFTKYYLIYSEIDSFFVHFKKSDLIFINDTLSAQKASLWLFRELKSKYLQEWFNCTFKDSLNSKLQKIYFSCETSNINNAVNFPKELTENYLHLLKIEKKKPIIAATLSIIPGLGELYIGNKQKGFLKLIMNTALAFQTKESLEKAPDALILNGINIGFFATFYVVNIYGAYIDTKTKKADLKNQLYIDVANYYDNMLL